MKKRIYIDTNIMLDLLGEREDFYVDAAMLASLADQKKIALVSSPISYATVNYFLSKFENSRIAKEKLRNFKLFSEICSIDEGIVEKSLNSNFSDFEDALHHFNAIDSNCEVIITRNPKDFKNSILPIMSPKEFMNSIKS
ncbi:type II toxin-antitoxin system VapC family toxin [Flavobacterium caeni]|uniref:Predicted nucleic acid-binding protein, contains PIN domain n=1 Tax=Flavobacterium caeni TaxID=490189 RepID=A0A1G5KIM7_9FLAO|nr:PIN domain-containing protein [Flavobacterium caeni]SCZ00101.1 Predicted nucleic acid-binding protein, contains PIN domain [Flavobacterium caeni]